MVKVIYDKSPLDASKRVTKEYKEGIKVGEILDDLECFVSCSIEINGVLPDHIRESHKLKSGDIVRIRKPLHGGADDRKILGRAIQVIGLIAWAYTGGATGALIAVGSSLVGGLIQASANRKAPVEDRRVEGEAAAEVFNLSAATNEFRRMEPLALPLGSHRQTPDFSNSPFYNYFTPEGAATTTQNVEGLNAIAQIQLGDLSGWTTIPAGWISSNLYSKTYGPTGTNNFNAAFSQTTSASTEYTSGTPKYGGLWPYELKLMPGVSLSSDYLKEAFYDYFNWSEPPGSISAGNLVTTKITYRESRNIYTLFGESSNTSAFGPTLIYHSDPNDPYFGTYSFYELFINMLIGHYIGSVNSNKFIYQNSSQGIFFVSSTAPTYLTNNFVDIYGYMIGNQNKINSTYAGQTDPVALSLSTGESVFTNLFSSNFDIGNAGNENDFFLQFQNNTFWNDVLPEFVDDSQFYNISKYLGSSNDVNTRKEALWGLISALNSDGIFPVNYPTQIEVPDNPNSQKVSHVFHFGIGDLNISDRRIGDTDINFYKDKNIEQVSREKESYHFKDEYEKKDNVHVVKGGKLTNNETDFSGPTSNVGGGDQDLYNWIIRETPLNTEKIEINISGRSFKTDDQTGEYIYFPSEFQVQFKKKSDFYFVDIPTGTTFGSSNADAVRETIVIDDLEPDEYIVRIRKKTKDPEDNRTVQEFNVDSFNFFRKDDVAYVSEIREGLSLVANAQTNGDTDNYNALVEASCYTDTTRTTWEHTRNPAWWFLYFARGGFINPSISSPTVGWHNGYHASNEERLFGAGLKDAEIDLEKIEEWAAFCDTNDLRCDFIFRSDQSVHEILQRIANAGRASVTYWCSKLSVVVEDPNDEVTGMFGMGNILKDSFTITYAVEDVPHKVVGKFTDRDDEWKTGKVEALVPNSNPENTTIEEIVLDGITEKARAQREINILAARQAYQRRTYSWETSVEGLTVRRGDKVYLSHDITCYNQSGRVYGATVVDGAVTELETNQCLETTTTVILRHLDGSLESYGATASGTKLILEEPLPLSLLPDTLDNKGTFNPETPYPESSIEDLIFFSGPQSTPGKAVRVVGIEPVDGISTFKISAIEEDPVIWAFEYDQSATPEQEAWEGIEARVLEVWSELLDDGRVKLIFETENTHGVYINEVVNGVTMPLQIEGGFTFYDEAVLDLPSGGVYNLVIEPFVLGEDYKKFSYPITVRT